MGQIEKVFHSELLNVTLPKPLNDVMGCSYGPIIEQGTHFCDLSRYFGGEIQIDTVQGHSLEWDEPAGVLSKIAIDENKIAPENRIPRATAATWFVLILSGFFYLDSDNFTEGNMIMELWAASLTS